MLHQTLANNEALYKWTLTESDLCSFCNEEIETIYHTYLECEITKLFWKELKSYIYSKLKGVLHPYPGVAETLVTNVLH